MEFDDEAAKNKLMPEITPSRQQNGHREKLVDRPHAKIEQD
jgi:hypothetical protein